MRALAFFTNALAAVVLANLAIANTIQPGSAGGAGALAAECAKVTCRTGLRELQLRTVDGKVVSLGTTPAPYVDDQGEVSIYAGEAIEISFDRNDVSHPKFVRTIEHVDSQGLKGYRKDSPPPDPATPAVFFLEFRQSEGKPSMSLILRNETGVALKYDVTMFVPTPDGMKAAHTSICPTLPGMMGDESWPHPIAMLLLSNFRKADVSNQFACE